ncbi:hypothetical protein [Comamonas sp. GB3 AK4-5]
MHDPGIAHFHDSAALPMVQHTAAQRHAAGNANGVKTGKYSAFIATN